MALKVELGLTMAEDVKRSMHIRMTRLQRSYHHIYCGATHLGHLSAYRFTNATMDCFAWITQEEDSLQAVVWLASIEDNSVTYDTSKRVALPRMHHECFPMHKEGWGYAKRFTFSTARKAARCIEAYLEEKIYPNSELDLNGVSEVT